MALSKVQSNSIQDNISLPGDYIVLPSGTTSERPASPVQGMFRFNTTLSGHEYFNGNGWISISGPGSTAGTAGRSAKDLQNQGVTANGLYYVTMHGTISATQHYCLMDTAYNGGGWTLLVSTNSGNNFASGSNYLFSVTTGTPSITANYGLDRRNTFVPAANDQFMIRREDTMDWVRFVVSSWSPTANGISNGWETTKAADGTEQGHPHWASGQMYDSSGNAVSSAVYFNGCAIGGNCGSGGGDGAGFGTFKSWLYGVSGYAAWGGGFNGQTNGGSPLFWNTTGVDGTRLTYWYRKAGTQ